jgi:hypothetical protein
MTKRVFIIHGWGGRPDCGWLKWLNKELTSKGFKVYVPNMPDSEHPKIEAWIPYLSKLVGKADENTYFVGHSIGCMTILRYLETLPKNTRIGGAVFVAGWIKIDINAIEKEEPGSSKIVEPWFETPINWKKIKTHSKRFVSIFSDNDFYVPLMLKNTEIFKKKLGAKIIIEKNKGHYIENITKTIPVVLDELLKLEK